MIVVDSNILIYFWLKGEKSEAADAAFRTDPDWVVPYLWRSEFRNVLFGYIRRKQLTVPDANHVMSNAETQVRGKEFHVSSTDVLKFVESSNCSAYDCEYVVLADYFGLSLLTCDRKILREFPGIARPL